MDDFAKLESWLLPYARSLAPPQRKKLAMAMMRELRRANAERIAANVEPDGSGMTKRKPRPTAGKNKRGRPGAMFRKLRLARNMKIRADADGGELGFRNALVGKTAGEHHFGLDALIGKTKSGRVIRHRMPERRLLGFGDDDLRRIMDAAIDHIGR